MQTETPYLSNPAPNLLEVPLSAQYLLDVGKAFQNVTHLPLMPQGLHCMVSP